MGKISERVALPATLNFSVLCIHFWESEHSALTPLQNTPIKQAFATC